METREPGEVQWREIRDDAQARGMKVSVQDVPSTLSPPAVEAFLGISAFIFGHPVDEVPDDQTLSAMRMYVDAHFVEDGRLAISQNRKLKPGY